jgi:hypothetical protein
MTTWRMDVRKDELPPSGWHEAQCRQVEDMDTTFGIRLRWQFWLLEIGTEVSGWTSMSPSTQARAYQWAEVLNGGPIDPKKGWGPETVEGKRCRVKVEEYTDTKGQRRAKVTEIEPINSASAGGHADYSGIPS